MIKALGTTDEGRPVLVLGLSFSNLDRLRATAGDGFMPIDGEAIGLPIDIMIFAGETEAHCAEILKGGMGPDTRVTVDSRLKS